MEEVGQELTTTDLTLAAYLVYEGRQPRLVATNKVQRRGGEVKSATQITWVFDREEETQELATACLEGQAEVEPAAFLAHYFQVKGDMVRAIKRAEAAA